jgi:hypothetical protein
MPHFKFRNNQKLKYINFYPLTRFHQPQPSLRLRFHSNLISYNPFQPDSTHFNPSPQAAPNPRLNSISLDFQSPIPLPDSSQPIPSSFHYYPLTRFHQPPVKAKLSTIWEPKKHVSGKRPHLWMPHFNFKFNQKSNIYNTTPKPDSINHLL